VLTPTATAAGANILARRPNPAFGAVLLLQSDQTASYHGLQITSAMRMSHHLSFQRFLHVQQTLSSVQLHNNTTQGLAQNYSRLDEDEGRADTDQRHVFSMSLNYSPLLEGQSRHRAQYPQRLEHLADHQAAQWPSVHRNQRERRRQLDGNTNDARS